MITNDYIFYIDNRISSIDYRVQFCLFTLFDISMSFAVRKFILSICGLHNYIDLIENNLISEDDNY